MNANARRSLFVLLFVSFAYFYQAGGWNQNSRFDLVRAITNEHTLNIDPFSHSTGDKAFFEGHYYSDKAPGLALTAVPLVAARAARPARVRRRSGDVRRARAALVPVDGVHGRSVHRARRACVCSRSASSSARARAARCSRR